MVVLGLGMGDASTMDLDISHDLNDNSFETLKARMAEYLLKIVSPRTRYCSSGSYTTYGISLQTSSSAFRLMRSETRRRFSDFVWLRKKLDKIDNWRSPPPLPSRRFWNLFDPEFIEKRREQLETWTDEVLSDPAYLSHTGLHLFVQTEMSVEMIEDYLHGKVSEERVEEIWHNRGKLDAYQAYSPLQYSIHYQPVFINFSPDEERVEPCGQIPPIQGLVTSLDLSTPGQLSAPAPSERSKTPYASGPGLTACAQHWTSTPDSGFQDAGRESSGSSASSSVSSASAPKTITTTASTTEAGESPESGTSSAETTTTGKRVRFASQASTGQKYSINGD